MSDDEDVKPEGSVKTEGGDGVKPEKKVPGLSERGSDIVQETIDRLLDAQGLIGEDLSDEGKLRRVSLVTRRGASQLTNPSRLKSRSITGSHTCVMACRPATIASPQLPSLKNSTANVSPTCDLIPRL